MFCFSGHLKYLLLQVSCILSIAAIAQQAPVHFKLQTTKKEPVSFAVVLLTDRYDTLKKISGIADSAGEITLTLKKGNQYKLQAKATNYQTLTKGIVINDHPHFFELIMEASTNNLEGVTVVSRKPLMKQEDDKTIVEPESLALASGNGYEVLEKIPGLYIDQDGNVYIAGTSPAKVYINGKDLQMSTDDMATLLKNLPPGAIDKIEILRTPSSKYDASGSGGIVNVILKKGVKIGTTGSISSGWQQGTYSSQFINFSLNNNNGKTTEYINLNIAKRNGFDKVTSNRFLSGDSLLSQSTNTTLPSNVIYTGYGMGYTFNNKWSLNYDGKISYNDFNNNALNANLISSLTTLQQLVNNTGNVLNSGKTIFTSHDISSVYKLDTTGSEWTNTVSYSYSGYKTYQTYNNNYSLPVFVTEGGAGNIHNYRNIINLVSDLKLKLAHHITIETGLKSSFLNYYSNTDFNQNLSGIISPDPIRTNRFRYLENINAFYLQLSKTFGKVILKAGVRAENTNMNGHQSVPADTTFNLHRTDLFPYIYLSRPIMKIAGYELRSYLVYRKSISRPPYDYLNPFPKYVNQYLYETGNPNLKPQFTQNLEANVSVDEKPIIALGYNDTKDIFANVMYQSDSVKSIAYKTYDNLGANKEIYFRALGVIPPGRKYFFVLGVQYNHNLYNGEYENLPLLYKRGSWTFFTFHNLKLNKLTNITLNGFVKFKGQQQFYDLATFGSLNTSINHKFLKEKLTVSLSCSDIFYTQSTRFSTQVGNNNANGTRATDSRRLGINLRYNFGFNKKEEKKNIFGEDAVDKQ